MVLFDRMERLVAGAKRRLARKVEESRAWQADGDRSAADWMARHSGTSKGRAKAEVESSKQLAQLPATDKAVANGALSARRPKRSPTQPAPTSQRRRICWVPPSRAASKN